jgi:hypothetical protein
MSAVKKFTAMKAIDEVRASFQMKMSNPFATVKILDESGDINKAWGNMDESYETSVKSEAA